MLILFNVVMAISFAMIFFCIFMLFRNNAVHAYRSVLLRKLSAAAKDDIMKKLDWEWRYDVFNSVPYQQMLHQFWRDLDDFYPDKSFLEPKEIKGDGGK